MVEFSLSQVTLYRLSTGTLHPSGIREMIRLFGTQLQ